MFIQYIHFKSMHHVHTLLLKTASASRFSSCLSSLKSSSFLRTSSSRICSSNVPIRSLLWRIKSLQFIYVRFYPLGYLFINGIKIFLFFLRPLVFKTILLQKQSFCFRNFKILNILPFFFTKICYYFE